MLSNVVRPATSRGWRAMPAQRELLAGVKQSKRTPGTRGWSAERLALEASLALKSVSKIERDTQERGARTLVLLLDALDAPSSELLDGLPVPPRKRWTPSAGRVQ